MLMEFTYDYVINSELVESEVRHIKFDVEGENSPCIIPGGNFHADYSLAACHTASIGFGW